MLCVSHDLHLTPEFCQRLILMDEGKIFAQGAPGEIITRENLRAIYGVEVDVRQNPDTGQPYVLMPKATVATTQEQK